MKNQKPKSKPETTANKRASGGRCASPCSQFEVFVKNSPIEHVASVKQRLEHAYTNSKTNDPKLKKAIAALDTEPGWFLNVNGIYREIILDRLRDLAERSGIPWGCHRHSDNTRIMINTTENLTHSESPSGSPPCYASWVHLGDDGFRKEHDEGDFEGAIITTAQVVLGGNGRWSAYVSQDAKGREKKRGKGRVCSKCVKFLYQSQFNTSEDAIKWADATWENFSA